MSTANTEHGLVLTEGSNWAAFTIATGTTTVNSTEDADMTEADLPQEEQGLQVTSSTTNINVSHPVKKKKKVSSRLSDLPLDRKSRAAVEKHCRAISDKYEKLLAKRSAEAELLSAAPSLIRDMCITQTMSFRQPGKFTPAMKEFAAGLYKLSGKAFRFVSKHLPMPSAHTVHVLLKLERDSRPADYVEPKPVKIPFTKEQYKILWDAFGVNQYPKTKGYEEFANQFGCRTFKVKKWFEKARENYKHKQRRLAAGLTDESGSEVEDAPSPAEEEQPMEVTVEEPEKTQRVYLKEPQLATLRTFYTDNKYPSRQDLEYLSRAIDCVDLKKIKRWFQCQRYHEAVARRQQS